MKRKNISEYAMETAKARYVTSDYTGTKTSDPRDAEILRLRAQVAALEKENAAGKDWMLVPTRPTKTIDSNYKPPPDEPDGGI